jgi:hypothetical protein
MTDSISQNRLTRLYRYSIASSDMYYTELEQRDVYVSDHPRDGFKIWGQIAGAGPAASVDLCQMFLEYAMYCRSWGSPAEAAYNMHAFGERLGGALARFLKENPPADMSQNPGACALECLFESMGVQLSVEQVGPELRFFFADCPLAEAAQRTGLREVEPALYGVNSLCQTLIHAIDPHLQISHPMEAVPNSVFAVRETIA